MGRAVVEALDVQFPTAKRPCLDRDRMGRVIGVQQVSEVEGAWGGGRLGFRRSVPPAAFQPASVRSAVLAKDVRVAEISADGDCDHPRVGTGTRRARTARHATDGSTTTHRPASSAGSDHRRRDQRMQQTSRDTTDP